MNGRAFLAEEQPMERKTTAEAGEVREEGLLRPKGCVLPSFPELGARGGAAGVHALLFGKALPKPVPAPCRQPSLQSSLALGTETWPKFLANPAPFLQWVKGVAEGGHCPRNPCWAPQGVFWEAHRSAACGGLSPNGHD